MRISVWLLILAVLCALIYLNQAGLPDFAKKRLLSVLREQGVDLRFSRLRLSFSRGILAENVYFGQPDNPLTPRLTISEVVVAVNFRELTRLRLQVDSLNLRNGRLAWPVPETNGPPRQLLVENIQSYLRFLPDDRWVLQNLKGTFAGAKFQLSGNIQNASKVRDWPFFQSREPTPDSTRRNQLRFFAETLEKIRFPSPPELFVDVRGDARDLQSFDVRVSVIAPSADTAWGQVDEGRLTARVYPAASGALAHAMIHLRAAAARTPWASTTNFSLDLDLQSLGNRTDMAEVRLKLNASEGHTRWAVGKDLRLTLHLEPVPAASDTVNAQLDLQAARVETRWASVAAPVVTAKWRHSVTNPIPLSAAARINCARAESRWGKGKDLSIDTRFSTRDPKAPRSASDSKGTPASEWGWWEKLEPYDLDCEAHVTEFDSERFQSSDLGFSASWRAPAFVLSNLVATIDSRTFDVSGRLDVQTRDAAVAVASTIDARKILPLLPVSARRWVSQFDYPAPPEVSGGISLTLPAWTNQEPDWAAEVLPTLRIDGQFNAPAGGSYRGAQVSSARSHLIYTNMCWMLPDLFVTRPEGALDAVHAENDRTKQFYWKIRSTIDPTRVPGLFGPEERQVMELLSFTEPPAVNAEIWGKSHDGDSTGIKGTVALTNFTFRGESITTLQAVLAYTNKVLDVTAPRIQRGDGHMSADRLVADFNAEVVYVTNGFSTAEPLPVARAIGDNVAEAIEPYQFSRPPTVKVEGIIPMHGEEQADLSFDIDGGPFHWAKFNLPHVSGKLHWRGLQVTLTDIDAEFYGGRLRGNSILNFPRGGGTEYTFNAVVTNAVLRSLMTDLATGTNQLDGFLSGNLVITSANTTNWPRADGYGSLMMRDGLIWDIPIFGVFSPILNGIAPGLGNSRAGAATATFNLNNGVFRTDDLDIRSTGMRLQYKGTIDVEGQVNAKVEAVLFRDMWIVGPIVSTVFWPVTKLFEYRATGSLNQLKAEPVYLIPKIVLMPLRPLRTIKGLLPKEPAQPAPE